MSAPVFVFDAAASAALGAALTVTGPEARHAVTVQRRAVGERVDVVDGRGLRASGLITHTAPDSFTITVDSLSVDSDPSVTLIQALAKGGRDEQAIEAATELGATAIIPWAAQRSIVQWKAMKAAKGRDSWADAVRAAAKQSRRALIPTVADLMTSAELARWIASAHAQGTAVVVLHESATQSLTEMSWPDAHQAVAFVVGPEGGIADAEIEMFVAAGAKVAVLGPHVLRASNAGPSAIAALAALRGTWNRAGTTLEP